MICRNQPFAAPHASRYIEQSETLVLRAGKTGKGGDQIVFGICISSIAAARLDELDVNLKAFAVRFQNIASEFCAPALARRFFERRRGYRFAEPVDENMRDGLF